MTKPERVGQHCEGCQTPCSHYGKPGHYPHAINRGDCPGLPLPAPMGHDEREAIAENAHAIWCGCSGPMVGKSCFSLRSRIRAGDFTPKDSIPAQAGPSREALMELLAAVQDMSGYYETAHICETETPCGQCSVDKALARCASETKGGKG